MSAQYVSAEQQISSNWGFLYVATFRWFRFNLFCHSAGLVFSGWDATKGGLNNHKNWKQGLENDLLFFKKWFYLKDTWEENQSWPS